MTPAHPRGSRSSAHQCPRGGAWAPRNDRQAGQEDSDVEVGPPVHLGGAPGAPWVILPRTPGPHHPAALAEQQLCATSAEKEATVDGDNDPAGLFVSPTSQGDSVAEGRVQPVTSDRAGFKAWHRHCPCDWTSHCISVSFSFPTCKVGLVSPPNVMLGDLEHSTCGAPGTQQAFHRG